MNIIDNVVPLVNGKCCNSTVTTTIRRIKFYVTTDREFFLLNEHGNHGTASKLSKDWANYDPLSTNSYDHNDYINFTNSSTKEEMEIEIDWDDKSGPNGDGKETVHSVANKFGYHHIYFYSYNSDYYIKNPNDESKSQKIDEGGIKNHIFVDDVMRNRVVTMTFKKGFANYIWSTNINLGIYPLIEIPEVSTISLSNCTVDSVPFDRFLYSPNLRSLTLPNITTKFSRLPDSLLKLSQLTELKISNLLSNIDPDTNGLRLISQMTNLKTLTAINSTDRYIKEFNDLPNLTSLDISRSTSLDDLLTLFSKDSITEVNPNLTKFCCLASNQSTTCTDIDQVTGKCLDDVTNLDNITDFGIFFRPNPINAKLTLHDWMDRMYNWTTLNMEKMFIYSQEAIDNAVDVIYEKVTKYGPNLTYVTDDEKNGHRNPWYGATLKLYLQSEPYNKRPSGTYQEVENPSTPMEKIWSLVNNYKWTVICCPESGGSTARPGETISPQNMFEDEIMVMSLDDLDNINEEETYKWTVISDNDKIVTEFEGDPEGTSIYAPSSYNIKTYNSKEEVDS